VPSLNVITATPQRIFVLESRPLGRSCELWIHMWWILTMKSGKEPQIFGGNQNYDTVAAH
jgi:hypothetical protein